MKPSYSFVRFVMYRIWLTTLVAAAFFMSTGKPVADIFGPEHKELHAYLDEEQIRQLGLDKEVLADRFVMGGYLQGLSSLGETFEGQLEAALKKACPANNDITLYFDRIISSNYTYAKFTRNGDDGDNCDPSSYTYGEVGKEEVDDYSISRFEDRRLTEYRGKLSSEDHYFQVKLFFNNHNEIVYFDLSEKRKVFWFWERWYEQLSGNPRGEWARKHHFYYNFPYRRAFKLEDLEKK